MKNVKKILFPTDFSEPAQTAFQYALRMADRLGASIKVFHLVYPQIETLDIQVMVAQATQEKVKVAKSVIKSFITAGRMEIGDDFQNIPDIQPEVEIGSPVSAIAKKAEKEDIDLIIMGTNGEHNALEKLLGSVAAGVTQKAPCPVMIIPESAVYRKIASVTYASDLLDSDPYEIWKLSQLLAPVSAILRCVHFDLKNEKGEAQEQLAKFETFFEGHAPALQIQFHLLPGQELAHDINEFIETYDTDLLVMYQPHRSFLEKLFHQSKTWSMALKTHIPLLVIKPKGL